MTPVDRQNRGRGRFLRVTSGHAARIRISSGFETELERPANPRGGRSKWNSTGPLFPSSRFLLLPLACPLLSISLSGEPPRRPLNVNDRSPNDEVPPMHNATLPLECNRNEHASNPEPLTKRVRSTSVYLFIYLPSESSPFLSSTLYPTKFVLEISLSLDHRWKEEGENCNWRTSFVSSPKDKTSKNISASLALTRSVQLFREFRCRQIYSLSRLGVYATLL